MSSKLASINQVKSRDLYLFIMWFDVDFKAFMGNRLLFLAVVMVVVVHVCMCPDNTQTKKRKLLLHSLLQNRLGMSDMISTTTNRK